MHDYDPEIPSTSVSEDLFFKKFPGGMPLDPTSNSMLRMLIVLHTIAFIYDYSSP